MTDISKERTMKTLKLIGLLAGFTLCFSTAARAAEEGAAPKVLSERGNVAIEASSQVDMFKMEKDRPPIERDFVQQPPLIPHTTKGYTITKNFNKCMDCHSWSRYKETGATKVSLTHFKDRDGNELPNISPRRYFCDQCHVPQFDAKPLVKSSYRALDELKRK
jgi:cytochrome c-type protein NapB